MALEVIRKVREVEMQAEELIVQVQKDSARMLKDANTEGKARYDAILLDAKEQGEQIISNALATAEEQAEKVVAQGKLQQKEIVQHSEERMGQAINLVIERIVDMYGNS